MKTLEQYAYGVSQADMRYAVRDAKRNGPNWTWLLTRPLGLSFAGRLRQAQRCPSWNVPEIVMIARYAQGIGCTQLARETGHSRFGLSSGMEFLGLLRSKADYLDGKKAKGDAVACVKALRQRLANAARSAIKGKREALKALRKRLFSARQAIRRNNVSLSTLKRRSRTTLWKRIKTGCADDVAIADYGATIPQIRKHIESLWADGMTWGNNSLHGWHIDHRKPCALFALNVREEWLKCFHYTNLQPLWATDNRRKSAKASWP